VAKRAKGGDEQTLESSWGRGHRQHKKRNSLDDFIVDDDDDEDESGDDGDSEGLASSNRSLVWGAGSDASEYSSDASDDEEQARREAVNAVLNQELTEEFTAWAGDGTDIQAMLLKGLKGTGSEASCKFQFLEALLKELIQGGHKVLIFSKWKITLNLVEVSLGQAWHLFWRFAVTSVHFLQVCSKL
jgi:SNF2 family DNA or RNA helicase